MAELLVMPPFGQDGASARRIHWFKHPGDPVLPHEPVAKLREWSSSFVVRLNAPAVLLNQLVEENVELRAGDRFAEIELSGQERPDPIVELAREDVLAVERQPPVATPGVETGYAMAEDKHRAELGEDAAAFVYDPRWSRGDDDVISRVTAATALMVAALSLVAQLFVDGPAPLFIGSIALLVVLAIFPRRRRGRHAR